MKKILFVEPDKDPVIIEKEAFPYSCMKEMLGDDLNYCSVGSFDIVCCDNGGKKNILLENHYMLGGPFIVARFDENDGSCKGVYNTDWPILMETIKFAKANNFPLKEFDETWKI